MEKMLKQLISILQEQSEILTKMIEVASNKTHMLACSNIEEINNIIEIEQKLNLKIDRIEKERSNVVNEITAFFDSNDTVKNISDIIQNISDPYKAELKLKKHEIMKQLDEYKEINDLNFALIENNINYVEFMINTISGKQEPHVIYGAKGYKQQKDNRQSFFDNKA